MFFLYLRRGALAGGVLAAVWGVVYFVSFVLGGLFCLVRGLLVRVGFFMFLVFRLWVFLFATFFRGFGVDFLGVFYVFVGFRGAFVVVGVADRFIDCYFCRFVYETVGVGSGGGS